MTPQRSTLPAEWTPRRVAGATLVVLAVAFAFGLLLYFRFVVFIIFIGLVVSMAVSPIVNALHRRGIPPGWGVILTYAVLLVLALGFVYLVVPLLAEQTIAIAPKIADSYAGLRASIVTSPNRLIRQLGLQLPAGLSILTGAQPAQGETLDVVTQALNLAGGIAGGLFTLMWILLIGFYWTVERERTIRTLLLLAANSRPDSWRELGDAIGAKVGAYVRGQLILAALTSVTLLVVYALIGLPYAVSLALISGLASLIPVLGPTLGAIPTVLLTLALDPSKVIWVVAVTAAIQFVGNNLLAPHVMRKTVGVNPVVTLLALVAFGTLFGFPGILLAIPMAAIIQIVIDRLVLNPNVREELDGRDGVSRVRYSAQELAQDVRKRVRHEADAPGGLIDHIEEAVEQIATDVDSVLARATSPEGSA